MYNPAEAERDEWLQDTVANHVGEFLTPLFLLLTTGVDLMCEIAYHDGNTNCGNHRERGESEGGDNKPAPQDTQDVSAPHRAERPDDYESYDTADNRESRHGFLLG